MVAPHQRRYYISVTKRGDVMWEYIHKILVFVVDIGLLLMVAYFAADLWDYVEHYLL